jgi:hypothetical protein
MNLLIAGDSYAQPGSDGAVYSWSNILSQQYNYNITNIAASATSLQWTYKRLMSYQSNFDNFDKIIVFVTHHGRVTLNVTYYMDKLIQLYMYVTNNLESIERMCINFPNEGELYHERLRAAKLYYMHLQDRDLEYIFQKTLINHIVEIVPKNKLILMQSFPCPLGLENFFTASFNMVQICLGEVSNIHKGKLHDFMQMYEEQYTNHVNHMIPENREIFASYINRLIKNPADNFFDLNQVVKIPQDKLDLYWKPKG